ncbi:MAG: SpoIIE family protein phosphatase [Streptosporangiales bacterium]|nr:SpoIIE family protein phosphatase [Streptosporangiales bacterium]
MAEGSDFEALERRLDDLGARERRVLPALFQELPLPVFLLDCGGAIRHANRGAVELLATAPGHVTGKSLPLLVDLSHRAALRSRLSALLRDGGALSFDTRFGRQGGFTDVRLHLVRLDQPGGAQPLVAAVATPFVAPGFGGPAPRDGPHLDGATVMGPKDGSGGKDAEGQSGRRDEDEQVLVAAARRIDLLARTARLLLHEDSLNEPVALARAAGLLQGAFADWAVIDLVRENEVQRAVVVGPEDADGRSGSRLLGELDPTASEIPCDVIETGTSVLYPLVEGETAGESGGQGGGNDEAFGVTEDGLPVLVALHAGSVLCVPLRDDTDVLGVLTLVRRVGRPRFGPADLGLAEELGEHLGLAIRTERNYQRRSEVAQALQASLLPRSLPTIPGLELAAAYRTATEGIEVGGDFYDVFDSPGGCGLVLGDVCGKGEDAAAITAMVRHGVRLLGLWNDRPTEVLRQVNHAMVVQQEIGRFATVVAAHLRWGNGRLLVRLASAGHPWPLVLRAAGGVHLVSGGGLPLGVFDDAEPNGQELELFPGDTLLLYSDGVTEARGPGGQLYGEQGLADVVARGAGLSASALVKAVEDDLDGFTGGRMRDDMALLAVGVDAG